MKSSSAKLNPLLRFAAAGTLLVWLSAVAMCQAHCCGDNCGNDDHAGAKIALHNSAANSHDGDKDNHHDDSACLTLKSALQSNHGIALVKPDFHFLYSMALVTLASDPVAIEPVTTFRQNGRCDWASTPEVCLGPALHSLAPPSLA